LARTRKAGRRRIRICEKRTRRKLKSKKKKNTKLKNQMLKDSPQRSRLPKLLRGKNQSFLKLSITIL